MTSDPETGMVYVRFPYKGQVYRTVELNNEVYLDLGIDDTVVGIEIVCHVY